MRDGVFQPNGLYLFTGNLEQSIQKTFQHSIILFYKRFMFCNVNIRYRNVFKTMKMAGPGGGWYASCRQVGWTGCSRAVCFLVINGNYQRLYCQTRRERSLARSLVKDVKSELHFCSWCENADLEMLERGEEWPTVAYWRTFNVQ